MKPKLSDISLLTSGFLFYKVLMHFYETFYHQKNLFCSMLTREVHISSKPKPRLESDWCISFREVAVCFLILCVVMQNRIFFCTESEKKGSEESAIQALVNLDVGLLMWRSELGFSPLMDLIFIGKGINSVEEKKFQTWPLLFFGVI